MWAFVTGLLLSLVMDIVEAKYCPYDVNGETRFYTCPRTEYCCNFGCCVSPAFQFYQLWYYWLLVIFMFLLCSGGGWWYRCWLRGRFPESQTSHHGHSSSAVATTTASIPPPRRSALLCTTRSSHAVVGPPTEGAAGLAGASNQFQVARVSYSTSGDRLILHRLWKDARGGLHHMDSPPSYSTARAETVAPPLAPTSAAASALMNPYVLYGPPPSYESVIQEDQAGPSGQGSAGGSESVSRLGVGLALPDQTGSCSGSRHVSPTTSLTPTTPGSSTSPKELLSPVSQTADMTSDEDVCPTTSHQASQTASSPTSL